MPKEATERASVLDVPARNSPDDLRVAVRLRSLLQPGEIAHAHGIRAGWICALAHRLRPFPFVITFHNLPPRTPLGRLAISFISRRADCLIAVSQTVGGSLLLEKTRIIPNGIEVDRFQGIDRDQAREALKIKPDTFAVGCIARLSREKGVDLLIEAAHRRRDIQFFIAGDGPERADLERSAPENVRFLGRLEDVAPLLAALDLLVIPSRSEGQGMIALEAFASNCPVLAASVGGLKETIRDGATGVLFDPENTNALTSQIDRLVQDSSLRDTLRQNAWNSVNQSGRIERMCRSIEVIYDTI